jgi:hypothetical protein
MGINKRFSLECDDNNCKEYESESGQHACDAERLEKDDVEGCSTVEGEESGR